jgi:hypothetical protein
VTNSNGIEVLAVAGGDALRLVAMAEADESGEFTSQHNNARLQALVSE